MEKRILLFAIIVLIPLIGRGVCVIDTDPSSQSVCSGNNALFIVSANFTGAETYQWQVSTNGGASFSNVSNGGVYSGVTTSSLTVNGVTTVMNNYLYRAIVTGSGGCSGTTLTSNSASLTVTAGAAVSVPVFSKANYVLYEKAEATFSISSCSPYSNVYDSTVVSADAKITLPNLSIISVPCFYYVPVTFAMNTSTFWVSSENAAGGKWMLRYAAAYTGIHTIRIEVKDASGTVTSANATITVTAGIGKGFIRLDPSQNQFTRFDNGTPYYPVGTSVCCNDGTLVDFYNTYLSNMATNKYTWMRYWLNSFGRQALEWNSTNWSGWYNGIGKYSQSAAGLLDSVLNEAERKGIYMQLVFQHHGQVSTTVNPEWSENPYNSNNGGPVPNASPGQWFTNATAIAKTKMQYRYIVARWGYSSHVMAWELFNEVEFTNGVDADIDSWHNTMSTYLKSIDPNKHLVITSSGGDDSTLPLFDNNANMDQTQYHIYANSVEEASYTTSQSLRTSLTKPVWCGEFGSSTAYPQGGGHPDNWGDHVRKTMWVGMFSEVPAMFWFFDEYVRDKNFYSIFKPLGTYLEGIDIVARTGGAYQQFSFTSNPIITGSTVVSPTSNFSLNNSPDPWITTIDSYGDASGTTNLSSYIKGSFSGGVNRDVRFTATFQSTGSVVVNFAQASSAATVTIQAYLDGALSTTWTIPTGGGTFTLGSIPAGTHTIRFYNNSNDWAQVNSFTFNNVSIAKLKAYGYSGATQGYAYGYVYDQSYGEWIDPSTLSNITTAQINIGSLPAGSYKVDFFDPKAGTAFYSGGTYSTTGNQIVVPLPAFIKDIAFKVYPSGSLPVTLAEFSGKLTENGVTELTWTTASEKNSNYFRIMRSRDGIEFEEIGTINAAGNSTGIIKYMFTDPDPHHSVNYYRLEQVDMNNSVNYSSVILIDNTAPEINVYPNPCNSEVFVSITSEGKATFSVSIINSLGELVQKENLVRKGNENSGVINISHLPDSVYILLIQNSEGKTVLRKIFKN